ncbi:MAG TPA: flagellar motor switch protein FliM [Bdellovibrionota bacterium]|jgi:flagellar motor switch protein FliM|nr:flagellar motor switch protein FliM [Bdellovibrionota bacterium]
MSQVLSQKEVDALLNAVVNKEVDTNPEGDSTASNNVIAYDLASQDKVIRGRMPTLDIVYERFIRAFRMNLSGQLRKLATLSIAATDSMKFGEFTNTLPLPSCMSIVRFETLRGNGIVVLESKLAYAFIDSFLGGTDRPYQKNEGKEFTTIELSIVRRVVKSALEDLEKAWAPVTPMKINFLRTETNPQFVGIVPPSDIVIVTTLTIELENVSGSLSIVIPFSTLEPIRQKLLSGFQQEVIERDDYWAQMMVRHLEETDLNVRVELGSNTVPLKRILELKLGDVLPLQTDASAELAVEVEGVTRFRGLFGSSRGSRAIQVTEIVENPNKEFLRKKAELEQAAEAVVEDFDEFI